MCILRAQYNNYATLCTYTDFDHFFIQVIHSKQYLINMYYTHPEDLPFLSIHLIVNESSAPIDSFACCDKHLTGAGE